jgi:hypothetical protein
MTQPTLKPGDVVRYEPDNRWTKEGLAVAEARGERVILFDTFWGNSDRTHVEPAEFEVLFNLADYDVRSAGEWERHHPNDRRVITHQHGLQRRYYVRKGAAEHLPTQVANARERVAEAEEKMRSAQWSLSGARRDLAAIEAKAAAS